MAENIYVGGRCIFCLGHVTIDDEECCQLFMTWLTEEETMLGATGMNQFAHRDCLDTALDAIQDSVQDRK